MLKFHLITQFKFHLITQFPAVALPLGVNIRRCSHKKPKLSRRIHYPQTPAPWPLLGAFREGWRRLYQYSRVL